MYADLFQRFFKDFSRFSYFSTFSNRILQIKIKRKLNFNQLNELIERFLD